MGPLQKIIIGSLTLMLLEWSCNQPTAPDCLQIGGSIGELSKPIAPFTHLILQDHLAYVLHPSSQFYIEIKGPKNLLNEIDLNYNQHELTISNQNTCNIIRPYKDIIEVHVYAPEFPFILDQSTVSIETSDTLRQAYFEYHQQQAASQCRFYIHCDSINIEMPYGVGDVDLYGTCNQLSIYNGSIGIIRALNLKSKKLFCNQSAIQDIYIQNAAYTYIDISNSGNIYYQGQAIELDLNDNGEGQYLPLP